jgi:ATP-dependent DNA helicase RecG
MVQFKKYWCNWCNLAIIGAIGAIMEVNPMRYVYPERESKSLEFKSEVPNFNNLIKTCVAFANGMGGKIIIGVDDKSREIIGIDERVRNRIYDEFPNSLYDATSPSLLAEIYEKRLYELNVIIIEIPYGIKKPVFIKSEGTPKGVYLRAGSSTRRASQEYIEELMRENKRITFDEETIHVGVDVFSKDMLKSIFKRIDTERLVTEKIIGLSSAHSKNYYPTVAGILTFCESPHLYVHEAVVHCTRFRGIEGREIIQSEEIQGNLEKQIETSFQLVKAWLIRDYKFLGAILKGSMIIPEIALREAIVNALIHRKYWIPGATKIALYDNRLEIFNPGNFPGLFDLNHLGDGTTYLRNPNLARIARRLGLIEKLGTGIRAILDSCSKVGIKRPEFIEGADSVKIIFNFLPAEGELSTDEDKLLALFDMRGEIKLGDVEKYLNISRNTATRKLNQLIKVGKIKRQGKGPAVKYVLFK